MPTVTSFKPIRGGTRHSYRRSSIVLNDMYEIVMDGPFTPSEAIQAAATQIPIGSDYPDDSGIYSAAFTPPTCDGYTFAQYTGETSAFIVVSFVSRLYQSTLPATRRWTTTGSPVPFTIPVWWHAMDDSGGNQIYIHVDDVVDERRRNIRNEYQLLTESQQDAVDDAFERNRGHLFDFGSPQNSQLRLYRLVDVRTGGSGDGYLHTIYQFETISSVPAIPAGYLGDKQDVPLPALDNLDVYGSFNHNTGSIPVLTPFERYGPVVPLTDLPGAWS